MFRGGAVGIASIVAIAISACVAARMVVAIIAIAVAKAVAGKAIVVEGAISWSVPVAASRSPRL
jgi:hypothetical protein